MDNFVDAKDSSTTLVNNGLVDYRREIADKRTTGGWKAAPFIIVAEMAERVVYFTIVMSLGNYFHKVMHFQLPDSMTHVTDWVVIGHLLAFFGAFVADAFLGRFMTIVISSSIFTGGVVMLTLSATLEGFQPPPGLPASRKQEVFLYGALAIIAIGIGGIKPCVSTFGADQFDETDASEAENKHSFFNWFYLSINVGAILGIGGVGYVSQKKGVGCGFAVSAVVSAVSLISVIAGYRRYRYQKQMGSPLTRFAQVIVAAYINHRKEVRSDKDQLHEVTTKESDILCAPKLNHTQQYRFLDKAAIVVSSGEMNPSSNRWRLCTVTQVEEFKCVIRLIPIFITTIALSVSYSQVSTFFMSQSTIMNRDIGEKIVPPGMVVLFISLNPFIVIPIYVCIIVPFLSKFTGHPRGITSLQRIGVGLFISIFAMMSAALVEKKRLNHPDPKSMSFLWLAPQIFLIGTAEAFAYVGQLEFFYDQSSQGTRSITSALFLSQSAVAHFLSGCIVKGINRLTGGAKEGWLRNDLNKSRLDYFYWILCAINAVNLVFYLWAAYVYKGRNDGASGKDLEEDAIWDEEVGCSGQILNN